MQLVVLSAACGVGKTTIKEELHAKKMLKNFACMDTDQVGINWWDYAGTEQEDKFSEDCLIEAVKQAAGKNLLFSSCMNPFDFYGKVHIPLEITSTFFIAMTCSDEEIRKRLKARPMECRCGDEEFIKAQMDYNNWFRKNKGKFPFYIDNTAMTIGRTAEKIADFVARLS